MKKQQLTILNIFCIVFLCACFVFSFPKINQASTDKIIYLSPGKGVYSVGDTFTVEVLLDSGGESINAAEAELRFNPDELRVESIAIDESIFSLWTIPPAYSNEIGMIEFAGGTRDEYVGGNGVLAKINFKALRNIVSRAHLTAGVILSADGAGSNIITDMKSGVYTFKAKDILALADDVVSEGSPDLAVIYSPTHPDENNWYKESDVEFRWDMPDDADAVRLLVDDLPNSAPKVLYDFSINKKVIEDNEDGIWYFHLQMKNQLGWGDVSHFRFQIDSEDPNKFIIKEIERLDATDPVASFSFDVSDRISGVNNFEIQINDNDMVVWEDDGNHIYEAPVLPPNNYVISVKAVDKAGNYLVKSINFKVEPLEKPVITGYPEFINSGEIIKITGKSSPDSGVEIIIEKDFKIIRNYNIFTDKDGLFVFVLGDKLEEGSYSFTAMTYDDRGAQSMPTEKMEFQVKSASFMGITSSALDFLSITIPMLIALVTLGLVGGYIWHRLNFLRKKNKK